jgi:hypothetical protein
MLKNWFSPVASFMLEPKDQALKSTLAKEIKFHKNQSFPILEKTKIAIIGAGNELDLFRSYLYQFAALETELEIADLGNFKKRDSSFIIQALREIIQDGHILPVILGAEHQVKEAVAKALAPNFNQQYCYISNNCNHYPLYCEDTKDLSFIGFQAHLCDKSIYEQIQNNTLNSIRLGDLRAKFDEAEARMRNASWIHFDPSVLKHAESGYFPFSCASGINTEEACQLMRYAGISNQLKVLSFEDIPDANVKEPLIQLLAQLLWYFLDGQSRSMNDSPKESTDNTSFIIHPENFEHGLKFIKNNVSGRWWLELFGENEQKENELFPCSYNDYQKACNNIVSDRIIRVLDLVSS